MNSIHLLKPASNESSLALTGSRKSTLLLLTCILNQDSNKKSQGSVDKKAYWIGKKENNKEKKEKSILFKK